MTAPRTSTFVVPDICCAQEETVAAAALSRVRGVRSVSFDLSSRVLKVEHTADTTELLRALRQCGFPGRLTSDRTALPTAIRRGRKVRAGGALFFLSTGAGLSLAGVGPAADILLLLSMALAATSVAPRAWRAVRARRLDVNLLMSAAAIGAIALGEFAEGAAVLALYDLSLLLEDLSIDRTRRAVGWLVQASPETGMVVTPAGETAMPVDSVSVGEVIRVRPGERVALDARVVDGTSTVDESALTGESLPRVVGPGSTVYAGSLNQRGSFDAEVAAAAGDSLLHRIGELVDRARARKGRTQTTIERVARWYVPGVFATSLLLATVPPLAGAGPFVEWFYRALTVLVISCPCALLLATPVSVISAITGAARRGVLIRDGGVLERLGAVKAVALDKTGTVTRGFHEVVSVRTFDGLSEREVIGLSAALESRSEHPLAGAVLRHARKTGSPVEAAIGSFEAVPGRGVRAVVNGATYVIGNHAYIEELGLCTPEVEQELARAEDSGATVLILASDERPLGMLSLADTTREESTDVVHRLRREVGGPVMLLTGDTATAGRSVARSAGMDAMRASMMPEEKVRALADARASHGPVAMVGDGVNDAPALAAADVGIAVGGTGSDAAIDAADVVLMNGSIRSLPSLFRLGRRTRAVIRFNIAAAIVSKAVFLLLGIAGLSSLWLAILADDGVTLLVMLNSLRLLRSPLPEVSSAPA